MRRALGVSVGIAMLFVGIAGVACGSSESSRADGGSGGSGGGAAGSGGGPGALLALDELPQAIAEVSCSVVEDCLGPLTPLFTGGGDCVTDYARGFAQSDLPLLEQAVADGRVEYHPENVEACLAALGGLDCDLFLGWYEEDCEAALTGTVPEGGDCSIDEDCAGNLFCRVEVACPGQCAPRGAAGDPCEESDDCAIGSACSETAGECQIPLAIGEACIGGVDCALPGVCLPDVVTGAEECTDLGEQMSAGAGEPCSLVGWTLCAPGLFCPLTDGTGGLCTSERALTDGECVVAMPDQCPAGQFCDPESGPPTRCRDLPAAGQACAPEGFSPECAPDHVCDAAAICRPMQALEAGCAADEECYSGACRGGRCVPPDPCAQ